MTFDIFAEVERDIKRPLREGERVVLAGLFLGLQLPKDRRKRKRCARNALQKLGEVRMKAKGEITGLRPAVRRNK
jgi:hypothetical protein